MTEFIELGKLGADEVGICMNVVIENCRSVNRASIYIKPGKLNVKFAPIGMVNARGRHDCLQAYGGRQISRWELQTVVLLMARAPAFEVHK